MNIETDCIACIFNQALRVTKELNLSKEESKKILDIAGCMVPSFSFSLTPPQNATPMYEKIAQILDVEDIYKEQKVLAIKKAESLYDYSKELIKNGDDPIVSAIRIAVGGNVLDLASEYSFDLTTEIQNIIKANFAIDHMNDLKESIDNSKNIVYLADNAGENVFDRIFIETIKDIYPDIRIYYFVREKPIINDICFKDLINDPILDVATVINSGIKTPGVIVSDLNDRAKELFYTADTIISKGMGNYECLSDYGDLPIFYLLKVKCQVVASSLHLSPGDLVCKSAQKVD